MTHPKVLERYKEHNWVVDIEPANDAHEKLFLDFIKKHKLPMKKVIQGMFRTKVGNEEYFWYHESWQSHDLVGNEITHFNPHVGKYEDPIFSFDVDTGTGEIRATGIQRTEPKYELKWPDDITPEIEKRLDPRKVDLNIITPEGKHYHVATFEQFKNESFENLVNIGRYGTKNQIIVNELKKDNTDQIRSLRREKIRNE
jgi:hypothetical protein